MATEKLKRRRNRADAEEMLRNAVERLLVQNGFGAVTPSAVGREAGLDKMLIYRYFGDLEGLMRAVINRPKFYPSFEDLCAGDATGLRAAAPAERIRLVLHRFVAGLMNSPVALELMAWEMVERNELTAIAESAREALGLRLISEIFSDLESDALPFIAALLSSAMTYLLLRRRKIRTFDGLDLTVDSTWTRLVDVASVMSASLLTS